MNFMKKNIKLLVSLVLTCIFLNIFVYTVSGETSVVESTPEAEVSLTEVGATSFVASNPRPIEWFPIDEDIINYDSDFFPIEGWGWGTHKSGLSTVLEKSYHTSYPLTDHLMWSSPTYATMPADFTGANTSGYYTNDRIGDGFATLDDRVYVRSSDYELIKDILETYQLSDSYRSYKDGADSSRVWGRVKTNWAYEEPENLQIWCENDVGVNASSGGLAFLAACFKYTDPERQAWEFWKDGIYWVVGAWDGNSTGGSFDEFFELANCYDAYHAASANPNVYVKDEDNVGAEYKDTTEEQIVVGPFQMSNYVSASNYGVYGENYLIGTVEPGGYENERNQWVEGIFFGERSENLQGAFGSDYIGSVIQMKAVLKNEDGETKEVTIFDRNSSTSAPTVPGPGKSFDITLDTDDTDEYDEIYAIKSIYQRVHACASAIKYVGWQYLINAYEAEGTELLIDSARYDCQCSGCTVSGLKYEESYHAGVKHYHQCDDTGYCYYGHDESTVYSSSTLNSNCSTSWACGKSKHDHSSGCNTDDCEHEHGSDCCSLCAVITGHLGSCNTSACDHTCDSDCCDLYHAHSWGSCGKDHDCSKPYCEHGYSGGDHSSTSRPFNGGGHALCTSKTLCTCHNHQKCMSFQWGSDWWCNDEADDVLSLDGTLVNEQITYTTVVNIPLKTDISIYKYITQVTHPVENIDVYDESDDGVTSRKELDLDEKEASPLETEVGDLISYTVEIENKERFPVYVLVQDTLPEHCELIKCVSDTDVTVGDVTIAKGQALPITTTVGNTLTAKNWIPVAEESTTKIIVQVKPTNEAQLYHEDTGNKLYENVAEFLSKNHSDPYIKVGPWYDRDDNAPNQSGSIINLSDRIEDKDYHIVKGYEVHISKYIYDVEHNKDTNNPVTSTTDTTYNASTSRKGDISTTDTQSAAEKYKEAYPVFVEYGDIITYKINIDNTVDDWSESPYYEPEKIYVDIIDTLPEKVSNVEVKDGDNIIAYTRNGRTLTISDFEIPANSSKELTVTLIVEEHERGTEDGNPEEIITKHENRARITQVRNINNGSDDEFCVIYDEDEELDLNYPPATRTDSSDFYVINDYDVTIEKYLYGYDETVQDDNNSKGFSNETGISDTNEILKVSRYGKDETSKQQHPVSVDQNETITYAIRVNNNAVTRTVTDDDGNVLITKPGTQVRPRLYEKIEKGLEIVSTTAKLYNSDGTFDENATVTFDYVEDVSELDQNVGYDRDYQFYMLEVGRTTIMDPGQYMLILVEVDVVESNMFLLDLRNSAKLGILENINIGNETDPDDDTPRQVRNDTYDENIAPEADKESSDYVRMKDLVFSGKVWLDLNRDGLMNAEGATDQEEEYYKLSGDSAMKADVTVKLYTSDGNLVRTTKTDANGLYTFGRKEDLTWYEKYYTYGASGNSLTSDFSKTKTYQRIDKATEKDENGNYTPNSKYINYYIEYEYDGVIYKSTDYAGMKNLSNNDGSYNTEYLIDSNATEFSNLREQFNQQYEYISYNVGYDVNLDKPNNQTTGNTGDLEFDKTGHTSQLIEDETRLMTSRSFIMTQNADEILAACNMARNNCGAAKWKSCPNHWSHWQAVIAMGIIDESQYANTHNGRVEAQNYLDSIIDEVERNLDASGNTEITKYLCLFNFNRAIDNEIPKTEYLKYINFGLQLREDVDITVSKDVYKVKTIVNGEEMIYEFNQLNLAQNEGINGQGGLTNDYISGYGYNLELYESDYKYRVDQYLAEAVKAYKGIESELNIEVTYKIRIHNRNVKDDESRQSASDTKLNVKIHEVMDLYDQNFIKYKDDENESITIKVKDDNGYLVDSTIRIAEVWLNEEQPTDTNRLVLSNTSVRKENLKYSERANDYTSDGYNTLYIRGKEISGNNVTQIAEIPEGEYIDIYVKYVIDKGDSNVEIRNDEYVSESNSMTTENVTLSDGSSATKQFDTLARCLKIAENPKGKTNGLGIENIAQLNAYSVWYTDGKPASLVDMDSNAGNIGITNNGSTKVDDSDYYEDTVYKTGVDITAQGTENDPDGDDPEDDPENNPDNPNESVMREFRGAIWDDARTHKIANSDKQYVADGIIDGNTDVEGLVKLNADELQEVKINESVSEIYKDGQFDETEDIMVRSAKAEYVEIVEIPNGAEAHYYEEILNPENVTWKYTQNTRSNDNGEYLLNGFIPGTYVLRYTYGDTIGGNDKSYEEGNEVTKEQEDMLIFNGQDYKSTKYNSQIDSLDGITQLDDIINLLESTSLSDARDDEIRRLEVNSYSEVMVNETAEILKGLANGEANIPGAGTANPNSKEQLKELTDNTSMNAETVEFLVKPEKIDGDATNSTTLKYQDLDELKYQDYNGDYSARTFAIKNIDFGIEYRSETGISLGKEIDEVKIITEDGNNLIDLFFYTENDTNGEKMHYIDETKSIGEELTQFISNEYTTLRSGLTTEDIQGLAYLQVDDDVLQGATIEVIYKFTAMNDSEIDMISNNLNLIRYKENPATVGKINEYTGKDVVNLKVQHEDANNVANDTIGILDKNYTASGTAKNMLIADYYRRDDDGDIYRIIEKSSNAYTGMYVGDSYYTRQVIDAGERKEVVSELKFDKILDYVDTDLVYVENANAQESKDREWDIVQARNSDQALVGGAIDSLNQVDLTKHVLKLRKIGNDGNFLHDTLTNIDEIEYKTLVVSVDDRRKDDSEVPGDLPEDVMNESISRFMQPKVVNEEDSKGYIYLPVSKVIASETDTKDMVYENIAEVIQYTTLTGRRTNFDTTIGNVDIHEADENATNGSEEFVTASLEADSSATETITLTPPTGLMKNRRIIVDVVETAQKTVSVTAVVAVIAVIVIVLTKVIHYSYKKRRIK